MRWCVGGMLGLAGATSRRASTYLLDCDRGRVPGRDVAVEAGCVVEHALRVGGWVGGWLVGGWVGGWVVGG